MVAARAAPGRADVPAFRYLTPHHKRWSRYAIDDCTRIRVLKVYDACKQRTAIQFLSEVLGSHSRSDNLEKRFALQLGYALGGGVGGLGLQKPGSNRLSYNGRGHVPARRHLQPGN